MCSDMVHIVLPANNTISAFTRKYSPGGATTHIHIANARVQLTTHLSTPRGWLAELAMLADIQRRVYPEEVTRQLYVMAQGREGSPVLDRHFTVLRHQPAINHVVFVSADLQNVQDNHTVSNNTCGQIILMIYIGSFHLKSAKTANSFRMTISKFHKKLMVILVACL